jgi:hypothetical protein
LMRAESSGDDTAANPRLTALGPFQFIKTTFIDLARRHFASEIAGLSEEEMLALRTNRAFARRAAAIYCRESAAALRDQGLTPNYAQLRLAFLLGPAAATRLLQAPSGTAISGLLPPGVLKANPFMVGMTVADLTAKAARDLGDETAGTTMIVPRPHATQVAARKSPRPEVQVAEEANCKTRLASCRRFVALRSKSKAQIAEAPARTRGKGSVRKKI